MVKYWIKSFVTQLKHTYSLNNIMNNRHWFETSAERFSTQWTQQKLICMVPVSLWWRLISQKIVQQLKDSGKMPRHVLNRVANLRSLDYLITNCSATGFTNHFLFYLNRWLLLILLLLFGMLRFRPAFGQFTLVIFFSFVSFSLLKLPERNSFNAIAYERGILYACGAC